MVFDFDEDLLLVQFDYEVIDLCELVRGVEHYLFLCCCVGMELVGVCVDFFDVGLFCVDWMLVGCECSCQIHKVLYGADPVVWIDFCLWLTFVREGATLLKCCLFERGIERDGEWLVVLWGAMFEEVRSVLHLFV